MMMIIKKSKDDKARTFAPPDNTDGTSQFIKFMNQQEYPATEYTDLYNSDSHKSSSGSRLKILTKQQMLSRLPILLAQIQAGNNSIKLKNEIRQILYLLYRSKTLTKTVYNNLLQII